ncbi:hemagglutinin repeat-containing protein [Rhizobium metallidurans]|uniref:hemagglutinin repeat-containing protein n=1 Tax=Rhizobium metallidurans TaxID=1265931 RepID=UPI00160D6D47
MNSSSASSQSTSAAIGVDLASGGLTGNASYGKGTEQTDGVTQINTHVVGSGFSGVPKNSALEKGTLIDRYGSTIGTFLHHSAPRLNNAHCQPRRRTDLTHSLSS